MFQRDEMVRAVDLQTRSYALLQWVGSGVDRGFISFNAAHSYSSAPEAAQEWIVRHYQNIPEKARPPKSDLAAFSAMLSTYLENSFELVRDPGKRADPMSCRCPFCIRMIDASHLKPRAVTPADKKRARRMMTSELKRLALESAKVLPNDAAETLVDEPTLREPLALCAYGSDLLHRVNGVATGPAVVALWRTFAWLPSGSPDKSFVLSADKIIAAEALLRDRVLRVAVV